MNSSPFQRFIELIKFDQGINSKEKDIQKIEIENGSIKSDMDLFEKKKDGLYQNKIQTKKEVDSKELEMKELDILEKDKKSKLDGVSTQQEYKALKKEIATIRQQQGDLEEVLIDSWNSLDLASKEYEGKKVEFEEKIKELVVHLEENNKKIEDLRQALAEEYKKRLELEIGLPEEWIERYAMMRATVSNPVVPVVNGCCSVCFYDISSQSLLELKRKKLVECKGCFRFLYLPEEE